MYIIKSKSSEEHLYWSNELGWTAYCGADHFTEEEKETLNLPIDGEWQRSFFLFSILNDIREWGAMECLDFLRENNIEYDEPSETAEVNLSEIQGIVYGYMIKGTVAHQTS